MSKENQKSKSVTFIKIEKGQLGIFRVGAWKVPFPPETLELEIEKLSVPFDESRIEHDKKVLEVLKAIEAKLDFISYAMAVTGKLDEDSL